MVTQRNFNFRQSNSERAAGNSYGNFKKGLARKLKIEKFKLRFKSYGKS
jgi:hypothetical protein